MKGQLYEGQKHSTHEISQYLGLSHSYLYRVRKNVKAIKRFDIDYLQQIARLEGLKPEELREKMLEYAKKEGE